MKKTDSKQNANQETTEPGRAKSAADLIQMHGYDELLKKEGWDAVEAAVRGAHHEKIAERILFRLPKPEQKDAPKAEAKTTPADKAKPFGGSLEGRFIEWKSGHKKLRGIVLCEEGRKGSRLLEVMDTTGDVPEVNEAEITKIGPHFADIADDVLDK